MPWSNQSGGGGNNGPWGPRPGGSGGQQPDLEDILRKSQDRLRQAMPGGGGGWMFPALIALIIAGVVGWFGFLVTVKADEVGIVLRFGEYVRQLPPGLHFRLPYPIEEVKLPQVTRLNRVEIGMRGSSEGSGLSVRDVPEESLMLTGDENIVDIDFVVVWKISDAPDYLFKIQNPKGSVKDVSESSMREIIGQSDIEPILTASRAKTEGKVQNLMQTHSRRLRAGIEIVEVQLQKVDPPAQVIDAFRDVQAARADEERLQNEAQAYANRIVPEARGEAERILQSAQGYRDRVIAEAKGEAERFEKVLEEYAKAPEVTRQRIFIDTMQEVLSNTDKMIIDKDGGGGVVPYLPLIRVTEEGAGLAGRVPVGSLDPERRAAVMKKVALTLTLLLLGILAIGAYMTLFTVYQTQQALVLEFGKAKRVIDKPGLNYKVPFIQNVVFFDKRLLDLDSAPQEVIAADQKRLVVDAFARWRITDPLLFYQAVNNEFSARTRLGDFLEAALRRVLGSASFEAVVRDDRERLDAEDYRRNEQQGQSPWHYRRRCTHQAGRSAGGEQSCHLPPHADGASTRGRGDPRRR